jgi:hypothetical protein
LDALQRFCSLKREQRWLSQIWTSVRFVVSPRFTRRRTEAGHRVAGKAQAVVDEIKASGGDAIAVGGDVMANDFPKKLIGATIE